MMPDRWRVFDLVEAFHLAHAVATLHNLGLFKALERPATADELSSEYALDAGLLRGVLEYVAARTDLLRKSGERFVASKGYADGTRFLLDLYVGAYGGNSARLDKLLRDPMAAPKAVNRALHARAFDAADGSTLGVLPEVIGQLGLNHLLDLGCGSGALLLELAARDSDFVGWGIDANPAMCKSARARIREARLGKRLRVFVGDCGKPGSMLPKGVGERVHAVTACHVANEMFGDGHERAVAWLRSLRRTFPGRPLLLVDYYGRLGRRNAQRDPRTLLHDYVQLISGQGVPPSGVTEWRSIYERAGCRPLHIIEDKATTRFIHILRL